MNLIIHLMVVMLVHIFYLLVRASLASFIMDVGFFAMAVYGFPGLLTMDTTSTGLFQQVD